MNENISFSIFASPECLTKQYSTQDGKLVSTGASNYVNHVRVASAENLVDVLAQLDKLAKNECVGWGIPHNVTEPALPVVTKAYRAQHGGLSRTKDCFTWPSGPGVLMLDLDMPHTPESARADILTALKLATGIDATECEMVWRPSSSNGVYVEDPTTAKKSGRIYMVAQHGGDIRELGLAIEAGLWALDKGHIRISVSGKPLPRCLVDTCVWQPERLDYVAPAVLTGAAQRLPVEPVWWNAGSDKRLPKPRSGSAHAKRIAEQSMAKKAAAKTASEPECRAQRSIYIDTLCTRGVPRPAALAAVDGGKLTPGFKIKLSDGTVVDVQDILNDPVKYNRVGCYDPFEPSDDGRVAIIYTNRSVYMLYSQLHAGTRYLIQSVDKTTYSLPPTNSDACAEMLGRLMVKHFPEQVFLVKEGNTEPRLVWVNGLSATDIEAGNLGYVLSTQVEFVKINKKHMQEEVKLSAKDTATVFHAAKFDRLVLPRLRGVVNRPWLNPVTGVVHDEVGYDSTTQLYLAGAHQFDQPLKATPHDRIARLLEPYNGFEFYDIKDRLNPEVTRALALNHMLCMASRATLGAPSVAISAGGGGKGKTYYGMCLLAENGLAPVPVIWPVGASHEEKSKVLGSCYKMNFDHILLDNADGTFASRDLNTILDKPVSTPCVIRLLGGNNFITCFNNIPVILTGINISFDSEAEARRFFLVKLAPKERHLGEGLDGKFADPLFHITRNWTDRHMDRLALLQDYAAEGFPRDHNGKILPEDFSAYPDYDRWVRGLVWHYTGIDPVQSIKDQIDASATERGLDPVGVLLTIQWLYLASLNAARTLPGGLTAKAEANGEFDCITGEALEQALESKCVFDTAGDEFYQARAMAWASNKLNAAITTGLPTNRMAIGSGVKNGLSVRWSDDEKDRNGRKSVLSGYPLTVPSNLFKSKARF